MALLSSALLSPLSSVLAGACNVTVTQQAILILQCRPPLTCASSRAAASPHCVMVAGVFSPGVPATFHANFQAAMGLLDSLEAQCPTNQTLSALRTSPAYTSFLKRWKLSVYFSLRFQVCWQLPPVVDSLSMQKWLKDEAFRGIELGIMAGCWHYSPDLCDFPWQRQRTCVSLSRFAGKACAMCIDRPEATLTRAVGSTDGTDLLAPCSMPMLHHKLVPAGHCW